VREEEARKLEEELKRTQLEMEEKQKALQEALTTPQQLHVNDHEEEDEDSQSHSMLFICKVFTCPCRYRDVRVLCAEESLWFLVLALKPIDLTELKILVSFASSSLILLVLKQLWWWLDILF
jgi:hypothetical protein